jgi:hypothetical protein
MIVFIPQTDPESNPNAEPDWEWLPSLCPACGQGSVIGHGRRRKQAHGGKRTSILVRRGISKCCGRTCTVLPAWSLPGTQYSLETRRQSYACYTCGAALEEAAPPLADPDRSPDASTLRRWFERRLSSLSCWVQSCRKMCIFFLPPTILAWDWQAAVRILVPESNPG